MDETATEASAPKARRETSPEQKRLIGLTAQAIWTAEAAPEARRAEGAFKEVRAEYVRRAKRLLAQMERRGLSVTAKPDAPDGDG